MEANLNDTSVIRSKMDQDHRASRGTGVQDPDKLFV